MANGEQYYAQCVASAYHDKRVGALVDRSDIAFIDLGRSRDLGSSLAIAVYTAPEGEIQEDHLDTYEGTEVRPVSREELLWAFDNSHPDSVFFDGKKIAGSLFKIRIKDELGIPRSRPWERPWR
jgi:hypothetical protein